MKNPFLKIQLIESIKFNDPSGKKDEEIKENNYEHMEIVESMERRFKL
jgi:hypothetical protein